MKPILLLLTCFSLVACSPYKKVTLTMGDQLTQKWKGATERAVVDAVGSYKSKVSQPDGYIIRFDYSYLHIDPQKNTSGTQFRASASTQQQNYFVPRPSNNFPGSRSMGDSVIRYMDFYFDKAQHVQYVYAAGYPDSVYYVKRHG